jgi:hypothetical protein
MNYLVVQLLPYLFLTFSIGFIVGWASVNK